MMIPRRIKMMNNLILKKKKYDINFMCNYKYIKILKIFLLWKFKFMKLIEQSKEYGDWGLGIWGLGIGDWAQSPSIYL